MCTYLVLSFLKADANGGIHLKWTCVRAHCGWLTVISLLFGNVVTAFHTQFGSSMWPQAKHKYIAKGSELVMSIMLAYLHTRLAARRKPPGRTHWATKVTSHSQERWHEILWVLRVWRPTFLMSEAHRPVVFSSSVSGSNVPGWIGVKTFCGVVG